MPPHQVVLFCMPKNFGAVLVECRLAPSSSVIITVTELRYSMLP